MAGETILIVDDAPINLKLTRLLLLNEGYRVLTASTAEEALHLLGSSRPDLILADIQLPGMDGFELTRRIKADERTKDIPVVALTAFTMKADEQKAMEAGCDGYLTKPIDTRELGARIRSFLERKQAARGASKAEEKRMAEAEVLALQQRFLSEGYEVARQWLEELDGDFHIEEAARLVHQWIGASGLLGYTELAALCREVEGILRERPLNCGELRDALRDLVEALRALKDSNARYS
jgi:two-component system cell cycle response regulator DivK